MKLLYITSLSGIRINSFMRSAIVAAMKSGIDFTMACNMDDADKELYELDCKEYGISVSHIDFDRNPFSKKNLKAKKQLLQLMKDGKFDVVHCNTPIGGVLGRICAKEAGINHVIYQAHGFHFWKGAPLKNWIMYYPVERILARHTDILITINQEDYECAQRFRLRKGGKVEYVHGVGVDIIHPNLANRNEKRKELGISFDCKVYVSVGQLNKNKNHESAIKAFIAANLENSILLICGKGELDNYLEDIIVNAGFSNRILLLGFRKDVIDILNMSDVFVFPSYREGLSAALMEAMAIGLPCMASRIRGNVDLLANSKLLFDPKDLLEIEKKYKLSMSKEICSREKAANLEAIKDYSFDNVVDELCHIYSNFI